MNRLNAYLVVAALAAAGLAGVWLHGARSGALRCEARQAVAIERERDRQAAISEAARMRESARLAEVRSLQDALRDLEAAAAADPGARGCGLGAASVQRLDRIR